METSINYDQPDKAFIQVYEGGKQVVIYEADNNIFDIVPPKTGKIPGALCYKCASFIKEGECRKGELNKKTTPVKFYQCIKFFDKDSIKQTEM